MVGEELGTHRDKLQKNEVDVPHPCQKVLPPMAPSSLILDTFLKKDLRPVGQWFHSIHAKRRFRHPVVGQLFSPLPRSSTFFSGSNNQY